MTLYDQDYYAWTQTQATALKERDFVHLDIENLIEEVESMGRSERRELGNRLEQLLLHLLKWRYQAALRGNSWRISIRYQRTGVDKLLRENPSVRAVLGDIFEETYQDAMLRAEGETGLLSDIFPGQCPFSLSQVLDRDWLPD